MTKTLKEHEQHWEDFLAKEYWESDLTDEEYKEWAHHSEMIDKLTPKSVKELFSELEHLHKNYNIIWTIGSGETHGKLYCGITHPKDSEIWKSPAAWFASDSLSEILEWMIKTVRSNLK